MKTRQTSGCRARIVASRREIPASTSPADKWSRASTLRFTSTSAGPKCSVRASLTASTKRACAGQPNDLLDEAGLAASPISKRLVSYREEVAVAARMPPITRAGDPVGPDHPSCRRRGRRRSATTRPGSAALSSKSSGEERRILPLPHRLQDRALRRAPGSNSRQATVQAPASKTNAIAMTQVVPVTFRERRAGRGSYGSLVDRDARAHPEDAGSPPRTPRSRSPCRGRTDGRAVRRRGRPLHADQQQRLVTGPDGRCTASANIAEDPVTAAAANLAAAIAALPMQRPMTTRVDPPATRALPSRCLRASVKQARAPASRAAAWHL